MHEPTLTKQVITSGKWSIDLPASLQDECSAWVESTISQYWIEEFWAEYPQEVVELKDLFKDSYTKDWPKSINFRIVRKFLYKYKQSWWDLLSVLRELKVQFYDVNSFLPNIITFLEASDRHTLIDILRLIPVLWAMDTSRFFKNRFDESERMGKWRMLSEDNKEIAKPINTWEDGHYLLDILSEFSNELNQLNKQDSNAYVLLGQYGKEILEFLRNHREYWSDVVSLEKQTWYHDTVFSSLEAIWQLLRSKESGRWRGLIDSKTPYNEVLAAIKYLLLYPESRDLVDSLHEKLGDHYIGFLQDWLDLAFVIELFDSHREIWDSMAHYADQTWVTAAKYIGKNSEKIIYYAKAFNWDNIKELIEANVKQGPEILETLDMIQEITHDCSDDEYGDFYSILYNAQILDVDFFTRDNLLKLQTARNAYPDFYSLVVNYVVKFWNEFTWEDYMKFFVSIADYCSMYGAHSESMPVLISELEKKKNYSELMNFSHLSVPTYISLWEKPDSSLSEIDKIISWLISSWISDFSHSLFYYSQNYPQEFQKLFHLVRDGKLNPIYIFRTNNMSGWEWWIWVIIKGMISLPEETFYDLLRQIPWIGRHLIFYIEQFIQIQNFHLLVSWLWRTLGSLIIIWSTRLEYLLQTELRDGKISEWLIFWLWNFLWKYKDSWEDLLKFANKENISLTELLIRLPDIDKLFSIVTFEQSLPPGKQSIRIPKITPYKRTWYSIWDYTNPYWNYIWYTSDNSRLLEGVTWSSETLEGILHDPSLPRYERLTRFKKAYRDVFTLLAKITTEMIEYLSWSFDKYKSEQEALEDVFLEFWNSLKLLPSAMLSMLIWGLQIYIQKWFAIRNILNDPKYNNNPAKLLSDSLWVDIGKLRWMVSVDTDGANFVFYISNEHDYYLFYARWDSQKAHLEMIKSPSWWFSTSYSKIPQLQKTITCVNGLKWSDRYIETTKVHESRHTINSLIMPDYWSWDHLTRAKDEILAYMTDGRVWEMEKILSQTWDWALYDYYEDHKVVEGWRYKQFRAMYESELSKAIQIARRFYLENIPNHINLLALVPVRQWWQLYSVYFL